MKKARMNISHSRFILSKLKICGEIVTTKQKSPRQIVEGLFIAKNIAEAMYLAFPTWDKLPTKFNPQIQDFKRVLDLIC